ncbi:MAG: response regulator [Archangium sp.]|nr:response regulator [Archangium sp.]
MVGAPLVIEFFGEQQWVEIRPTGEIVHGLRLEDEHHRASRGHDESQLVAAITLNEAPVGSLRLIDSTSASGGERHLESAARLLSSLLSMCAELERVEEISQMASAIDAGEIGLLKVSKGGVVIYANATACGLLGYPREELQGLALSALIPAGATRHGAHLAAFFEKPEFRRMKSRASLVAVRKDGQSVAVDIGLAPLSPDQVLVTLSEARDRERAEAMSVQLRDEARLVQLGTLVASVGHEISNPLSYVRSNVEFLMETLAAEARDSEVMDALREVTTGVDRIVEVVGDLRLMARKPSGVEANVATVVADALATTQNLAKGVVRIETAISDSSLCVTLDSTRLVQVLVNLISNAVHSLQARRDGASNKLSVSVVADEERVTIKVVDNGPGIPDALRERVFEPFFSTKKDGTGLGLSVSRGIIRAAGGDISCVSNGSGTVFAVVVPRAKSQDVSLGQTDDQQGRRGRVLVVDDDVLVRSALSRLLRSQHDIICATSPHDALEQILAAEWDVILCDMVMPQISGAELFMRVETQAPEKASRFVFMTARPYPTFIQEFYRRPGLRTLDKPFRRTDVLGLLDDMVSRSRQLHTA